LFIEDLLIGPPLFLLVLILAWIIRTKVTDPVTKIYFLPALACKIIGAIALGLIYQYYYHGGDTFAFHEYGSKIIWQAFVDDPVKGIKLWFANGIHSGDIYPYSSRIWYFRDPQSFTVIQISSFFDLITFGTYSGTSIFFALISFSGSWMLFLTFYRRYPQLHFPLALSIFFIPSVIFWASGILKDTITYAAISWIVFCFDRLFLQRKIRFSLIIVLALSIWLIYSIKIFILLVLVPSLIGWYLQESFSGIKNSMVRILAAPVLIIAGLTIAYLAVSNITKNDRKYSLDTIAKTAQVTAYDIRYWTGKDAGSGYSLGELDGSFTSLAKVAPAGLIVTYFRPFIWEVKNPLMLLSSLEGLAYLILTICVLVKTRLLTKSSRLTSSPELLFCLIFSFTFAIAVGVSTYNFGTLARYKIPCISFYLIGLTILYYHAKREKNNSLVELSE
jgi:hypothetical protein